MKEIASIPLFAALAGPEQERVAEVSRVLRFDAGHVVVNEGEFAFNFYAITAGAADVVRDGERVATLGPGDVFGELGVVRGQARRWTRRRAASVIVTAPTEAIAIDGADFRRLTEELPQLRDAVLVTVAERNLPA
jgi:cAMP-dependent protein kinase regulator